MGSRIADAYLIIEGLLLFHLWWAALALIWLLRKLPTTPRSASLLLLGLPAVLTLVAGIGFLRNDLELSAILVAALSPFQYHIYSKLLLKVGDTTT
jgi:hypothetical protein